MPNDWIITDWKMCQVGRQIFLSGGDKTNGKLCFRLDKREDDIFRRFRVRDMLFARMNHHLCTDGRSMFATGGVITRNKYHEKAGRFKITLTMMSTAEVYDPLINKWSYMPNMKVARAMHSSCCLQGNLYVFCGYTSEKHYSNSIEKTNYAKKDKFWKTI